MNYEVSIIKKMRCKINEIVIGTGTATIVSEVSEKSLSSATDLGNDITCVQ